MIFRNILNKIGDRVKGMYEIAISKALLFRFGNGDDLRRSPCNGGNCRRVRIPLKMIARSRIQFDGNSTSCLHEVSKWLLLKFRAKIENHIFLKQIAQAFHLHAKSHGFRTLIRVSSQFFLKIRLKLYLYRFYQPEYLPNWIRNERERTNISVK